MNLLKKYVWIAGLILITLSGCAKKEQGCTPVSPAAEEAQILKYAADSGINVIKHSSGMYYQIITAGDGTHIPKSNSGVSVNYTGKLLNGTQFDQKTTPIYVNLPQVIEGWQIGIPLISKGGRIKLIIPSSLAYGCNGAGTIPSNAVLFFDINLVDVL